MTRREDADELIRRYFAMCNLADRQGLIDCFEADAVHYFPPGLPGTPWRGSARIADGWIHAVRTMGSKWTIEKVLVGEDGREAVIEWTHWKTARHTLLRGDEWYVFNENATRIREIRAYYASPVDPAQTENALLGFDYAARGYALAPPVVPGREGADLSTAGSMGHEDRRRR